MKSYILFFCMASSVSWATELFVRTSVLKVYENPSRQSLVLTTVPKGRSVIYLKKNSGMYVLVRANNLQGWVVKHSLAKTVSSTKEKAKLFQTEQDLSKTSQKEASVLGSGGVVSGVTSVKMMVFGEPEIKLKVPSKDKNLSSQYKELELLMNSQVSMEVAKGFIK